MIDVNKFNVLYLDSDNAKVDIKSNHFYVLNGSLFIYQLTKSAKEFIESNSNIESITIMPLLPRLS